MSTTEFSHVSSSENISEMERSVEHGIAKENKHKNAKRCALSKKNARLVEVATLTLVIVCAIVLLGLPSALPFMKQVSFMHDQR